MKAEPIKPWQPMRCPDVNCQWRGPAAKAYNWPAVDSLLVCPKCGTVLDKAEAKK